VAVARHVALEAANRLGHGIVGHGVAQQRANARGPHANRLARGKRALGPGHGAGLALSDRDVRSADSEGDGELGGGSVGEQVGLDGED